MDSTRGMCWFLIDFAISLKSIKRLSDRFTRSFRNVAFNVLVTSIMEKSDSFSCILSGFRGKNKTNKPQKMLRK